MSELYPDLNLSVFPSGGIDQFLTFLNITATDGPLIAQYQAALQAGNTVQANQILAQIPQGTQKIITATDLNKLTQAMLAVERFYKTDIEPYVTQKQAEWLSVINQFSYKGVWSAGTTYQVNNLVTYTTSGLTLVYLATSTPPVGTVPTNTQYWRLLTIQGQQGTSGAGLSYRQEWNVSTQYQANNAVTYDSALWMALRESRNIQPGTDSSYWQNVVSLETTTYPIQDTEPINQSAGSLWFNTSNNPTKYYYLESLTNPAEANEIVYGQEAYDSLGNLIVGTLPVPASLAVTTNPDKMNYIPGESFDPTGMVVTVTYTDGSESVVTNYSYSPTGPLASGVDTITIQYSEIGATVQTTLSINIITIDPILNNNSWALIRAISDAGNGENYWSVGDAKKIKMQGTVGSVALNNDYWVFILGFNHNSSREGNNRIHFQFGRTAQGYTVSNGICLVDSSYNSSTSSATAFTMNTTQTNSGGWNDSHMRNTIIGSDTAPTSPKANSFIAALPSDLRAVMKTRKTYTSEGNQVNAIQSTNDYCWLLAEYEIFGATTFAASVEADYVVRYQYYISGNSRVRYKHSETGTAIYWWERSPRVLASSSFCSVDLNGSASLAGSDYSRGIAPCFCV